MALQKIEAFKTSDGSVFEDERLARDYDLRQAMCSLNHLISECNYQISIMEEILLHEGAEAFSENLRDQIVVIRTSAEVRRNKAQKALAALAT
jgi:hypothetical protein